VVALRRRRVIRVIVLYAIAGWVVIEVTSTVLPGLNLPDWTTTLVILLVALGFVIAIMLAWAFDIGPGGIQRTPAAAIAETETVTASQKQPEPAEQKPAASVADTSQRKSIAVLPFVNMSGDAENEYFSDGISEEILNLLVKLPQLKVASRTSAFIFKGKEASIPTVARELGVDTVLEGSVRRAGERVRITAQLIEADSDSHLWSETYDRTLTAESVFEVQDDIAQAIVEQLGIIMEGDSVAPSHATDTKNISAYELYLEAWQLFVERRSLPRAIGLFEQAVAADPGFARAWAGLAAIYNVAPGWGYRDRDYRTLSREAAETAIRLNAELSLPYAVLSMDASLDWPADFEQALALFDEALARDPKNTTVYLWRTVVYLDLGYFDRAERDARQCLEIDPAYEICRSFLALAALFSGDVERALEIHETVLSHGFFGNIDPFLFLYMATGRERPALIALAANNAGRGIHKATEYEYRALTDPTFDYLAEKSLIEQAYYPAGDTVPVWEPTHPNYLFLYRQYEQLRSSDLPYWWYPYPLEFRSSPHRKRLIREAGLPEYWRKHGFPPQCKPVGDDDFECI